MYGASEHGFNKLNNDLYLISLRESDPKYKESKISELKDSGLFDLVEPNYKLSLDDNTNSKYVTITKKSEEENGNMKPVLSPSQEEPDNAREVTPNDKDFNAQYYLQEINAPKAWGTTVGDAILIAVLDTGVEGGHPDLMGKAISGSDDEQSNLNDDIGHGTEVSGIIAANTNNNQGIAGVSWNTKIISIRITDENGQARVSTVVSALENAYQKGAKIVHMSLSTNQFSQTLKNAIKQAQDRGILVVSTAGNSGIEEIRYPSGFDNVIGVGAVNQNKELETYSTTGGHVGLVAPGSSIYTTSNGSSYNKVSGTSFAAPQVTGAAALVWSIAPNLTSDEVRNILLNSADDLGAAGRDNQYGNGLLNLEKAVKLAKAKN